MAVQQTSRSPPERLQKPNDNHCAWLLRRIWDRINRSNEHFMGVVVGREGSGKSFTAIKIANEVDSTFTEDRIIFDVVELLKILKEGEHEPGNFYVLDEAGVQLGKRTWQDRAQILANQALQLIRDHNLGLLFTLPRLSELDSQTEGRLQALLELVDKKDGEYVTGKWKWMDPDRSGSNGKIYKKYPRRRENGVKKRITRVSFTPPSAEIIEPYDERKTMFQNQHYEKVIQEIEGQEEDEAEEKSMKEIAVEIADGGLQKFVAENQQTKQPYINKQLIRAEYQLSHNDASAVKALLDRQLSEEELEEYL